MPRPKPNKLHDELDALLDGRPVELTDELAPLAEAADVLRAELAAYQLDPEVADRHLERVLHGSATVVSLPVRGQPNGWDLRRRVAAVVLAAALVLAPATMASAAALPGQPMYPFKLAIEEIRVASVQWSTSREAVERTRVANTRLDELTRLVDLKIFTQVPTAITALTDAVQKAEAAVNDATREGEPVATAASRLRAVRVAGGQVVAGVATTVANPSNLPRGTRDAISAAVAKTQGVLPPPNQDTGSGAPSGSTPTPPAAPATPASGSPGPPSSQTQPSNSTPELTTTTGGPAPTTTTVPTTTTQPQEPTTTESTVTPGSAGGGDTGGDQAGADGRTTEDAAPAEETPADVPAP